MQNQRVQPGKVKKGVLIIVASGWDAPIDVFIGNALVASVCCLWGERCPENADSSEADVAEASMRGLRGSCWPVWAYRDVLKDAQVSLLVVRCVRWLGPFSSGCRRAAAFVTRMGISMQIWLDLNLSCLSLALAFAKVALRGFRPGGLDSFVSRFYKNKGFEGFNLQLGSILCPLDLFKTPRLCIAEAALEMGALEANGHACPGGNVCLSIEMVALMAYGSLRRFCLRLVGGTSLLGPSLLEYGEKDPIRVLGEV
ncbi:hypothetical protein CRG98_028391 [Punica granatum]|uniref:Uncharacterized protein n=1 Tax=Punica granatum TaxID=22663 RepID=A0A2I0J4Q1_PUNGR|nr:hypothetical protein CRG98_028391 [Punica granatum]